MHAERLRSDMSDDDAVDVEVESPTPPPTRRDERHRGRGCRGSEQ